MQKMTRAILHFLLLAMLCQDVIYSITLNCLPNDSCSCRCRNIVQEDEWEISCPPPEKIDLTVILDQYDQTATVHCHDMDTWPLEEIEIFKIAGKKSAVKFDRCPLPEWPLSTMIGNVENEPMNTLEISGLTSTMSKLTRRNFLRVPRIDELRLFYSGVVEFSEDALQDLSDLQRIRSWGNEISILPRGTFKGLTELEELYLNSNKMQRVNSLLFENLSRLKLLSLSHNHLKSFDSGTFEDLVNLTYLDIEYNYLTALPKDIFRTLEKLEVLQMSGNEFSSLPHRLLVGNSGLVVVEFCDNRGNLSTLPKEFFGNLPSLREVFVYGNDFTDLPEDIFVGSPRVKLINLSGNKFRKISEKTFKNMTSIESIDLYENELDNLPDGLFEGLEKLSSLNLRDNAIISISRNLLSNSIPWNFMNLASNQISEIESWSFSNFTNLGHVGLNKNELTSLPENIFWGSFNLSSLDISENKLTDLPVKLFRDSTNLEHLQLDANNLTNLPEGIFQGLNKLSELWLHNNSFTILPDKVLAQAISLRRLHFQFNRMTEIDLGHLICLSSIQDAYFSHNLITRIIPTTNSPSELLRCTKIPSLYVFALDHNNITNFLWDEILIFKKLNFLYLTDNRISSVKLSNFYHTDQSVTIDISRNNITKFAIDKIIPGARGFLRIGDNPIDCGCDVYQLIEHFVDRARIEFENEYVVTADHLTCSQPESMVGRPVKDLELETFECDFNKSAKPAICPEVCHCVWRPFDDTLIANCSYRNLTRAPYRFYGFEGIAIELNLTGNNLTEMSFFHKNSSKEYKYEKVTKIFLSHNRIGNVTFDVVPENLSVLHLDNNNLTRFHVAVAETVRSTTSLQSLRLHSNPWSCDGETREAFNILKEKLDRKIGDAFGKSCLDMRYNKNGDEKPTTYITYQMF